MPKRPTLFRAGGTDTPLHVNGQGIKNEMLSKLPRAEREVITALLTPVDLPMHTLLNEMGQPIKYAYFLNDGLASILNVMSDGKSVEVGLTGREGFVGLPLIVGFTTSPSRVLMQVSGNGLRIGAGDLTAALRNCPTLEKILNRFSQELGIQATQVAACNRLHEVDARLARWLLMSQDRIGGSVVPLTQEFLAHMLGTRRASVTVAASILQKSGLIAYKRGAVTVKNRRGLESAACECYRILTRQATAWEKETQQKNMAAERQ